MGRGGGGRRRDTKKPLFMCLGTYCNNAYGIRYNYFKTERKTTIEKKQRGLIRTFSLEDVAVILHTSSLSVAIAANNFFFHLQFCASNPFFTFP
jgi:hypothetical protein